MGRGYKTPCEASCSNKSKELKSMSFFNNVTNERMLLINQTNQVQKETLPFLIVFSDMMMTLLSRLRMKGVMGTATKN